MRKDLGTCYVIRLLRETTHLTTKEIREQPDLIESKRQLLKLKRAIKDYDKE